MKPRLRWADHFVAGFVTADQTAIVRIEAYQVGLAEGELRGRMALAREIEQMFGPQGLTADDATLVRYRQVH